MSFSKPSEGDHPRVCGEQRQGRQAGMLRTGSSPRVRGAAPVGVPALPRPGIIPACAGSSLHPLIPSHGI